MLRRLNLKDDFDIVSHGTLEHKYWELRTGSYPIPEPDVVMTLECYMETGTDTSARTLRVYDIDGTIGSKMW